MSDYCTLADIKGALGIGAQSYADDDINRAITAASRSIEQATGRRFYPDADAAQVRKYWPVNSGYCIIDDLCVLTSLVDSSGTAWTLDTDFRLDPINAAADGRPWTAIKTIGRPFLFSQAEMPPGGWIPFDPRITVTGKFGWAATPGDITQAAVIYAIRLMTRTRSAPLGVYAAGQPGESVAVRLSRTDPDVAALVAPYAITVIA